MGTLTMMRTKPPSQLVAKSKAEEQKTTDVMQESLACSRVCYTTKTQLDPPDPSRAGWSLFREYTRKRRKMTCLKHSQSLETSRICISTWLVDQVLSRAMRLLSTRQSRKLHKRLSR